MKRLTLILFVKMGLSSLLLTFSIYSSMVSAEPAPSQNKLQDILSDFSFSTPESCPSSKDQGSCWARSVMQTLNDQEIAQIYSQVGQQIHSDSDLGQINSAALHLYLESLPSADTPEGATPGIPVFELNLQLAALLNKIIVTVTALEDGFVGIQIFSVDEDGTPKIEEDVISLHEQPEALINALLTADISLLQQPGVDGQTGHVQPILFNWQPSLNHADSLLESVSLDSLMTSSSRVIDIAAVSSGNIPAYMLTHFSQLYGAKRDSNELNEQKRELESVRKEAAEKYKAGASARRCASCAKKALKLTALAGVSAGVSTAVYQKWDEVKGTLKVLWSALTPQMPLIARLDGLGVTSNSGNSAMPKELEVFMNDIPWYAAAAWNKAKPQLYQLAGKALDAFQNFRGSDLAKSIGMYAATGGSLIVVPETAVSDEGGTVESECKTRTVCHGEGDNKRCVEDKVCRTYKTDF